jgi:uroporphyrinogen-III synthase
VRVLITRAGDDAAQLAGELARHGIASLIEPLLAIVYLDVPVPDDAGVQALLTTSANGVRAYARLSPRRDLPVYAVGDATARTARAAGFRRVASAAGDVDDLAALVRRELAPGRGILLHAAASELAGDLAGALANAGFDYRRVVLYRAETAGALSPGAAAAIASGEINAVALFSPRTARTLARLLTAAGLETDARRLVCFALSQAVAAAAAILAWRRVVIATAPTQAELVAAIIAASRQSSG